MTTPSKTDFLQLKRASVTYVLRFGTLYLGFVEGRKKHLKVLVGTPGDEVTDSKAAHQSATSHENTAPSIHSSECITTATKWLQDIATQN
eukprot:274657-Amphidinium_carterae.1